MNSAATAGPIAKPVAKTASWIELARSSDNPDGPATSGMIDFLAVLEAGLTMALPRASKTSRAKEISIELCTMGIRRIVSAVSTSEIKPLTRLPIRSISVPRIGPKNIPGMEVRATNAPALAADPVISRASQGSAIKTIEPEITLVIFDSSTKR